MTAYPLDVTDAYTTSQFGAWEAFRREAGLLWHAADDQLPKNKPWNVSALGQPIVVPQQHGDGLLVADYFDGAAHSGVVQFDSPTHGRFAVLCYHQDRSVRDSLGLTVGRVLKPGEAMGIIGNSGWSTGPHSHTMVSLIPNLFGPGGWDFSRDGGGLVDPSMFFSREYHHPDVVRALFTRVGYGGEYVEGWNGVTANRHITRAEIALINRDVVPSYLMWAMIDGVWVSPTMPKWPKVMLPGTLIWLYHRTGT